MVNRTGVVVLLAWLVVGLCVACGSSGGGGPDADSSVGSDTAGDQRTVEDNAPGDVHSGDQSDTTPVDEASPPDTTDLGSDHSGDQSDTTPVDEASPPDTTDLGSDHSGDLVVDVPPDVCVPACSGKDCGPDGCGGECGTCLEAQDQCVAGVCQCQPVCDGKECGSDGCGGDCGTCPGTFLCQSGTCTDLALVEAGTFWMGCNEAVDTSCYGDEYPYHEVYLDAYYIHRAEVTVEAYALCVSVGACTAPSMGALCNWGVVGKGAHPVNCVTWSDANAYCNWAGKRLPTEAEWEKAARGTDGRKSAWGNDLATCDLAVMDDPNGGGCGCGTCGTWPPCSKSPAGDSPHALCDMAGNVWEWTADWYAEEYYATSPVSNPTGPVSGAARTIRGGYFEFAGDLRTSDRMYASPNVAFEGIGFRCAVSQ